MMKGILIKVFGMILVTILIIFGTIYYIFNKNDSSAFKDFKEIGKMMGGLNSVPTFQSGLFTEDGNYFVYTFKNEVERPDFDGSITIRGYAYPTKFQIINTQTGKNRLSEAFETGKYDQMYVLDVQGDLVWLMMRNDEKEANQLALYDIKANAFRFPFGTLEELNPSLSWSDSNRFFVNQTNQKGLLLEAADKRYYRINPDTGKAEITQGKFEMLNYNFATDFQVSSSSGQSDFSIENVNGSRQSITTGRAGKVSADDFIEVKFLTLTKNKKGLGNDIPLTYYKNFFFVLSPISTGDSKTENKDMELAMIDKHTLKTAWKLQLPQKELKTIIPRYAYERFYLKDNHLLVSNNDYILNIDLDKGIIVNQINLYQ